MHRNWLSASAALLLAAGCGSAQTVNQLPTVERRAAEEVEQIAPRDGADAARIEEIPVEDRPGLAIEQPQGRDLCDPSVSEAQRRAAGVDCSERALRTAPRPRAGTTQDPLLQPRDRALREGFEALDLGDDVPPTVILQQ